MTPAELRTALAELGLTQAGFAAFIDVEPRTVRRWLAGDTGVPRAVSLLCEAMRDGWRPE